jgi:hypothetical protein
VGATASGGEPFAAPLRCQAGARACTGFRLFVTVNPLASQRVGQRAFTAAAAIYREILRQIERDGYGAVRGRAVVARRPPG